MASSSSKELKMLTTPLSPTLRKEYETEMRQLEGRIAELEARRLSGDLGEGTRRQLHALEVKLQAVHDRLDHRKRRNNVDNHYSIISNK